MDSLEFVEIFTYVVGVFGGLVVFLLGFRIASGLSLSSQRRALRFLLVAVGLWVLAGIVEGSHDLFLRGVVSREFVEFVAGGPAHMLIMACVATAVYLLYRSDKGEVDALRRSALTDALTNLSNLSFFRRAGSRRFENAVKHGSPLACLMIDIDEFKAYNDRFGHEAGNAVLRCVAQVLRGSSRADDLVARYGGEEFVMLLNVGPKEAADAARRVREQVETLCSPGQQVSLIRPVTVSVGVAALGARIRTLEELIEAADEQMYRAKRAGKNAVFVAEDRGSADTA